MATFFKAGGGCQANDSAYWRAERVDSEGQVILACGDTENGAESLADHLLSEREKFLSKSSLQQLNEIANKDRILSNDTERAIRLIYKILDHIAYKTGD